jgi:hypothetical protein
MHEFPANPYDIPPELVPRHVRDDPDRLLPSEAVRGYTPVQVTRPDKPELVPSADGLISEILFTLPAYSTHPAFWPVYEDLWTKLPAEVRLVILAHAQIADEVAARLEELRLSERATLLAGPDEIGFSIWAEDGYVVVRGEDAGYFVEPFVFRRRGDALVADLVTNGTALRLYQAPLYFQGGNVLVGDDFFLLGADYIFETIRTGVLDIDPGAPFDEQLAVIAEAYRSYVDRDRELIVVGSRIPVPSEGSVEVTHQGEQWVDVFYLGNSEGTRQPLFHIDMFITLAGRSPSGTYRLLVGDPRLAAETLDVPVPPYALVEIFDDIAEQLTDGGFEVVRNPLPLVAVADPGRRVREWYFATGNNALVEFAEEEKRVLLPSYGHTAWPELARTDEANVDVWNGLGFDAQLLGDFHPFAQNLGAVHCIKKYLARRAG